MALVSMRELLDHPYYLGHSASNDHPPVNSWTSFMVVIALESPNAEK